MNARKLLRQTASLALILVFLAGCGAPTSAPTAPPPSATSPAPPPQYTLPSGPTTPLTVSLDAAAIGEPISPYVYGQFIEHQGRCIYGGIWAEMLRDRKFYFPVDSYFPFGYFLEGGQASPWRAVPYDTVVKMDTEHAWVGQHSPQIALDGLKPRGIVQDRLTLRQGREYDGRVILAVEGSVTAQVSLVWGSGAEDRVTVPLEGLSSEYVTLPFHFTAGADADDASLEITGLGEGYLYVGAVSLMPADNVQGMRADTLQLLKELGGTVYRWPGGTFVNNYNWQNAVGDRDKRAPFWHTAYWSDEVESNDFGPDEFMALVEALDAEAYIAVSATQLSDAEMAAREVEYFNGAADTAMGQLRAANGHPEPYDVRFWGVGNESWAYAVLNEYVELHKQVAAAMRAMDADITIIAAGGRGEEGREPGQGDWSEVMLTQAGDSMDLLSEHVYGPVNSIDFPMHASNVSRDIRQHVTTHRQWRQQYPALGDIRLALDEWNYSWAGLNQVYGEAAPRYPFSHALGLASGLHEMYRNSDLVYMANTHPVNVHGHIKTTANDAAFEATALPLIVYRHHFGTLPIPINTDTTPLDVAAAWTEDRQFLTIAAVNPTDEHYALTLNLQNAQLIGGGQFWIVTSDDPMAYNEPGQPPRVVIQEGSVTGDASTLTVPALSVILYRLPATASTTSAPPAQATQPAGQSSLFKLIQTVQVAPDAYHSNAGFVRANYVSATGNLVVTFGGYPTSDGTALYGCKETGDYYKEYTLDLSETGKRGALLCDAHGDLGSLMVGDYFYLARQAQDHATGRSGWRIIKYDAVTWQSVKDIFYPLDLPNENSGDPMVAYVNGQLDISGGYKAEEGGPPIASHHHFFTLDLEFLEKKLFMDPTHIDGASMIYLDGVYYFITADAFDGDVVVMQYDQDWKYLGIKTLIEQAHWPTGLAYDGQRFYLAYLDTSQRTVPGFTPVYLNVHLAVFDRDWNLVEDLAVTNYAPADNQQPGRPWLLLHNNRLYLSYDVSTGDYLSLSAEVVKTLRGYVTVYELAQGAP